MLSALYPVRDLRLSGQVIYVGKSSMEIAVRMEALNADRSEQTVMLGKLCSAKRCNMLINSLAGRFCMVCRDSKTQKARPVNPLILSTLEDEKLYRIGEG